jgi:VanZ family protein
MALIFFASGQTQPPMPAAMSDLWLHAAAYAGLAVLAVRAVAGGLPPRVTPRIAAVAFAIAAGYGVTDETHQMFVPGRNADINDLYADATGALIGVAACWAWHIIRKPKPHVPAAKSHG